MASRHVSLTVVVALWASSSSSSPATFEARLRAAAPAGGWIGYAVAGVPGTRVCSGWCRGTAPCRLQDDDNNLSDDGGRRDAAARPAAGEPLRIYLRLQDGIVKRVRLFSQSCPLDTQGQSVAWLDDVTPPESLAFMAQRVQSSGGEARDGALVALAHHADAGADKWLDGFVAPGGSRQLREHAAFWLGHVRGRHGFDVLRGLLDDPDRSFREHVVFGISQSPLPEAQDELFRLARGAQDKDVRGKALFWLGQRAGQRAVDTLARAADEDPDVEVKRQAVFGLSQLPKEEGLPQLLRIARTHREPEVRKAALFWLGQSGDARALALFEEILIK